MRFLKVSSETGKITADLCHNAVSNLRIYQSWYLTLWGNSGILPTPPLPHSHLLSYSSFSSSENSSSPPQQNGKIKLTRKITLILKGLKILSAASYPLGPQQAQSLHCKQETRDSWEEEEERRLWEWSRGRISCPLSSPRTLSSWSLGDLCRGGWIILENVHGLPGSPKGDWEKAWILGSALL